MHTHFDYVELIQNCSKPPSTISTFDLNVKIIGCTLGVFLIPIGRVRSQSNCFNNGAQPNIGMCSYGLESNSSMRRLLCGMTLAEFAVDDE